MSLATACCMYRCSQLKVESIIPPTFLGVLFSRYLHSKGVDFAHKNKGGNDPLNHAVAYGRRDIAAWLLGLANQEGAPNRVEQGGIGGVREDGRGEKGLARRRRDDSVLLDLARLTADKKMEAFLLSGDVS